MADAYGEAVVQYRRPFHETIRLLRWVRMAMESYGLPMPIPTVEQVLSKCRLRLRAQSSTLRPVFSIASIPQ